MKRERQDAVARSRERDHFVSTVQLRGIGTGISEASKRVPILPFATQRGKQESSYFRQRATRAGNLRALRASSTVSIVLE